jgi:acyl carrier protein
VEEVIVTVPINLDEVEPRVLGVVKEVLSLDDTELSADSTFVDDLNAASLDVMMLAIALEEEFDGSIPEDEWERFKTPADVIDYIKQRVREETTSGTKDAGTGNSPDGS